MDKPCVKCGSTDRRATKGRKTGSCRSCAIKSGRAYYAANCEQLRKDHRAYQKAHPASRRKTIRKHVYGWAPGEHERAEAALPNVVQCTCCSSVEAHHKQGWQADHNHETGLFRAYLCNPCNVMVGLVEKYNKQPNEQIKVYLEKYNGS